MERFLVGVFALEFPEPLSVVRVLEFLGQLVLALLNELELALQFENLIGVLRDIDDPLALDLDLPLDFTDLDTDHPDIILHLLDLGLSLPEDVLLDVGFLVEDAEFIVAVDELNTDVITSFADGLRGITNEKWLWRKILHRGV